ncbi:MAG: winged helix-turn-helix transcriptional regulator [Corynebacterium sp.]|jgi:DNA-binding HxlR family transcriptional regulator|uniref:winged helix-turn-helix transcriptional regulator n=1 Tax=unclassified Corynebacterium TaxID=2624378 RepID=UPI00095CDB94|nr:helix-turn-helix domain-containing protein [Corynebacterium sp. CNJ-954]OLT50307.1 hypothetical protein BJF89_10360 [Corynebacterium sp. CNJ-954]
MASSRPDRYCGESVRRTLDVIGGKWSMLILWELLQEECRYAELQRRVGGISQKVLSSELKSLVAAGLVEREVKATVPPQVTYRITERGRSLEGVFSALQQWGDDQPHRE